MINAEPETLSWGRLFLATASVAGLMGLFALLLRFLAARGIASGKLPKLGGTKRLGIVESMALDMRRRVVIVRCDDKEHLLLLGQNGDLVIGSQPASSPETAHE